VFCEDKLSEKLYHHAVRVKALRGRSNRPQTADAIRSEPVSRAVILKNSDTIGTVAGG
jgi:hypothetical protein